MNALTPFVHRLKRLELLSAEDFEYAESLIKIRKTVDSGTAIIEAKSTQEQIFFVLNGWAIKYKMLENGDRQIVNFVLPGDIIGMFSPIFSFSEHTVESISPMQLGNFQASRLVEVFRQVPKLAFVLAWMAGQDERILEEQIVRIGRRNSSKRMAHLMIELYRRMRLSGYAREEAVTLPVNQLLLSDALGLSHIHAHRIFRELEKNALIQRLSGRIILLNLPVLAALADFDESYLEPVSLAKAPLTVFHPVESLK
ncbi:Crp/Fnr family transcriptional regulator [Nitrosomonas sp.]|uniref:Crp/Fnr family transcriptional regulator n=1 Tax=Nitrosomonas sp. TaxID=42353 RepID=UPI001E0ED361|nr:Crp/Fnr family transcriptional regulator [Nitrosomonas sp.]MCB1947385.1 Crp/Fnr family transcriptional regulator [Nitrosomonas sp.]MCP5244298.1 Crp/Fnr family transcriptional regulator [Burkholderiales bacterium]MDR4513910.1 Crp/Fnr family transcriptional regulator [Nitrosomonas sp.]